MEVSNVRQSTTDLVLDDRLRDSSRGLGEITVEIDYEIREPDQLHQLTTDLRVDGEPIILTTQAVFNE